jgi:hypothetical protein
MAGITGTADTAPTGTDGNAGLDEHGTDVSEAAKPATFQRVDVGTGGGKP